MENKNHSDEIIMMNEIYPGLWIGSISSLRSFQQQTKKSESNCYWTIISLIDSEKLQILVDSFLVRQKESGKCQHVIWQLKDKISATFLCERLEEILCYIDAAVTATRKDESSSGITGVVNRKPNNCNNKKEEEFSPSTSLSSSSSSSSPSTACLVHCAQGVSRSAAVCAAWLISRTQLSLEEALTKIRAVRPTVQPNLGFLAALRALEQTGGDVENAIKRMKKGNQLATTATAVLEDSENTSC